MLDLNDQMVEGQRYTFHFHWPLSLNIPSASDVKSSLSGDSNFSDPVAATESGGTKVAFTYTGKGSNVGDAGSEMQSVINDNLSSLSHGLFISFNYAFTGADLGEVATTPSGDSANIAFWVVGGLLILVVLVVVTRFLHEVKE